MPAPFFMGAYPLLGASGRQRMKRPSLKILRTRDSCRPPLVASIKGVCARLSWPQFAMQGGCLAVPPLQHRQRLWIMIEQGQGATNGTAGQQVAAFIFLKRSRPAADHQPGGLLRQSQLFANAPDFLRLKQPFDTGYQTVQYPMTLYPGWGGCVLPLVTIPTGHIKRNALALMGKSHRAHVAAHRCPLFPGKQD